MIGDLGTQHADDLRFVEPAPPHVRLPDETDFHSKQGIGMEARHGPSSHPAAIIGARKGTRAYPSIALHGDRNEASDRGFL